MRITKTEDSTKKELVFAASSMKEKTGHEMEIKPSSDETKHDNKSQTEKLETSDNVIVVYQPDETLRLNVRLENETVWLTQTQLCELFSVVKSNVSYHLKNIYRSGELDYRATVQKIRTVQSESGRKVSRDLEYFNLDAIISLGYRINTKRGIQFRQWATRVLKEYMLHGYAFNQRMNQLEDEIEHRLAKHDQEIDNLKEKVDFFVQTSMPPVQGVFFDGQVFDAKVFAAKHILSAKKSILLIDS